MTPSPSPPSAVRAGVDELEGLLEKATPGPWQVAYPFDKLIDGPSGEGYKMDLAQAWSAADTALIVAAVNALPHLLAAIKAVDELADELETQAQARERIADSGSPGVNQYALREGARAQRAQAADIRAALALAAVDVTETAE